MKLTFLGAAHEVTGSCTLLETGDRKILVDCGMEQGADIYENCEIPVAPGRIDALLLTHAHIDHSGLIPTLVARGFHGPIFATGATTRLCDMMLRDSAHIQEQETVWRNRKAERSGAEPYVPVYTMKDVEQTMPLFESCDYERIYQIFDGVRIRFFDAGHLLGSSSIEITVTEEAEERILVFSGDVGNIDRPLIKDPIRPEHADFVVIESTYGNRLHGERSDYVMQLANLIQDTLDRGGNLVIPAFAVGRTQEMLYLIRKIKDEQLISNHPNFQVWVDSPMAVEATEIYSGDIMEYYDEEALDYIRRGIDILHFPGLHMSITTQESTAINFDETPKVIISASGMCEAGRIRHHLKHNLWRAESTILFVGYQTEGTLGRKLLEGAEKVKLFGEEIQVNARIAEMDGISGHADRDMLLDWIGNLKEAPRQIFVNHGQDEVTDEFAEAITKRFGFSATAPYNGAVYDLMSGECLKEGNRIRIENSILKKHQIISSVYEKLLRAGKRLLEVIEKNKGGANKDLKKFTDEINSLCDKWER
ncbi:MAG: MBL fold metallo-hydrolase RNA specificity domain-containing protein [Lachnospiraceae bacterium]